MTIYPLHIATSGYLTVLEPDRYNELVAIATMGYIIIEIDVDIYDNEEERGGKPKKTSRKLYIELHEKALEEDELLLHIITAIATSGILE